jgi:hypothetical protein
LKQESLEDRAKIELLSTLYVRRTLKGENLTYKLVEHYFIKTLTVMDAERERLIAERLETERVEEEQDAEKEKVEDVGEPTTATRPQQAPSPAPTAKRDTGLYIGRIPCSIVAVVVAMIVAAIAVGVVVAWTRGDDSPNNLPFSSTPPPPPPPSIAAASSTNSPSSAAGPVQTGYRWRPFRGSEP